MKLGTSLVEMEPVSIPHVLQNKTQLLMVQTSATLGGGSLSHCVNFDKPCSCLQAYLLTSLMQYVQQWPDYQTSGMQSDGRPDKTKYHHTINGLQNVEHYKPW